MKKRIIEKILTSGKFTTGEIIYILQKLNKGSQNERKKRKS